MNLKIRIYHNRQSEFFSFIMFCQGQNFCQDLKTLGLKRELLSQESYLYKSWKSIDPAYTFMPSEDGKEGNLEGRIIPSDQIFKESMDAQLMKYQRFVYVSYGISCTQWIYCICSCRENTVRKKYLIHTESHKSPYYLWLIKVFKGTYKLLLYKDIRRFFLCNSGGRSLRNSCFQKNCEHI